MLVEHYFLLLEAVGNIQVHHTSVCLVIVIAIMIVMVIRLKDRIYPCIPSLSTLPLLTTLSLITLHPHNT